MNRILKQVYKNNKCFGGIPIIFFGDLFQLAPVKDNVIYGSIFSKFTESFDNFQFEDKDNNILDELNYGDN